MKVKKLIKKLKPYQAVAIYSNDYKLIETKFACNFFRGYPYDHDTFFIMEAHIKKIRFRYDELKNLINQPTKVITLELYTDLKYKGE